MIRKFNGNNFMKGKISWQLQPYVNQQAITFEKGKNRNTCIIVVNESKIPQIELNYLYKALLSENREIKE